ncbi:MAG: DUF3297 family protein [Pseudomonadota bacterium]
MSEDETNDAAAQEGAPPSLPDRLCVNPKSPYYDETVLSRDVGLRFNGEEKHNVEEYCVSEGWIRVALGNKVDRKGNPLTMKFKGAVEPYYRDAADGDGA